MNIGQWVHLSVDDVIGCFQWVYENKPVSIFEEPMLDKIQKWHEEYNLSCYLYVFEQCDGFSLEQLQDCYWKELAEESRWLKIGWHRRKAGLLTDDDEMELASLERVYKLVKEKASENLWADKIRLHRWEASEKLLQGLEKASVKILLTPDSEKQSYQLTETEAATLWESGYLEKEAFLYRTTDVRLDRIIEGMTVDVFCLYTESLFSKHLWKPFVECFFHENMFQQIFPEIDKFWENFGKIKQPLIVNAGVQAEEQLYFTACNTPALYIWNQEEERAEIEAVLPCRTCNCMKFSDMIFYKGCIWMIPWYETNIYVYHLKSKKTDIFPLSFLREEREKTVKFRKAVADNGYLWLLPYLTKCIIKINMEDYSVAVFSDWPKDVGFAQNRNKNFSMMAQSEDKLYLFRDGCTHNIVVDMQTGRMSIWNIGLKDAFGIFIDRNRLLLSPVKQLNPVRLIDIRTAEEIIMQLPGRIWQKENVYAFWYSKRIGNNVYIFPHEANAVVCYDMVDNEIKWYETDITDYCTLRPCSSFAMYDAFQTGRAEILFPYMGNVLLSVTGKEQKKRVIKLFETVQEKIFYLKINETHESKKYPVKEYLSRIAGTLEKEWTEILKNGHMQKSIGERESIGEKIHRKMQGLCE